MARGSAQLSRESPEGSPMPFQLQLYTMAMLIASGGRKLVSLVGPIPSVSLRTPYCDRT
jgi:hypothetical protein